MRRRATPTMPDRRQPWQIAQGARCCGGTDDMCACQNEDAPWRYGLAPKPVETSELADLRTQVATLTRERDEARADAGRLSALADRLDASIREVAIPALEPMRNAAARIHKDWPDDDPIVGTRLTVGHLRRASQAHAKLSAEVGP